METAIEINSMAYSYLSDIFSKLQWAELDSIVQEISNQSSLLEHVTTGVNRLKSIKFSLDLHRFVMRVDGISTVTQSPYAKRVLKIINNSSLTKQVSTLIEKEVDVLRMQLNIMSPGDFISKHTDQESDDAYLCSILIRTTSQYVGGYLTIYDTEKNPHRIRQPDHSVLAMSSQRWHEVDPIISGYRYTICAFLG